MSLVDIFLLPLLLGLIGFFEPCSLGINALFLARVQGLERGQRVAEALKFTLVRALVLSTVGISAAFVGSRFVRFQGSFFVVLGIFYILLGVSYLGSRYWMALSAPWLNLSKLVKRADATGLGVVFGLNIPACAIPLILALLGKALVGGDLMAGYVSLLAFGLALSSPLLVMASSKRAEVLMGRVGRRAARAPHFAGFVLVAIGLVTILSSRWWYGAT